MRTRAAVSIRVGFLLLPLLAAGCVNGVGWLPDSKGFVFTTDSRALCLFDVERRSTRVIVADTKSNTYWPAVSSDGKQVVIARLALDRAEKGHLQVVAYNLAGKVIHESPEFPWGEVPEGYPGERHTTTQLFWEPGGQKLLVYGSIRATHGITGIYDLETKKMKSWDRTAPAIFGGSPVRPDGKGFLIAKMADEERLAGFDFVDWSGKSRRITGDLPTDDKDRVIEHLWPILRWSEWRGNTAVLTTLAGRTQLDTDKGTAGVQAADLAEVKFQRDIVWSKAELAGGVQVMVLAKSKRGTVENFDVVTWDPKRKVRRLIVEEGSDRMVVLVPSPDRKYVVVRVSEGDRRGPDADLIYVVNSAGQVIQTVNVSELTQPKE